MFEEKNFMALIFFNATINNHKKFKSLFLFIYIINKSSVFSML